MYFVSENPKSLHIFQTFFPSNGIVHNHAIWEEKFAIFIRFIEHKMRSNDYILPDSPRGTTGKPSSSSYRS
jgi:hypothetical protein